MQPKKQASDHLCSVAARNIASVPEGFSTPSKQTESAADRAVVPAVYYSMSSPGGAPMFTHVCKYVPPEVEKKNSSLLAFLDINIGGLHLQNVSDKNKKKILLWSAVCFWTEKEGSVEVNPQTDVRQSQTALVFVCIWLDELKKTMWSDWRTKVHFTLHIRGFSALPALNVPPM